MHEQWYMVELLSDVAVTADAATAGSHVSLDYLPGSLFLGAVAASIPFDPERMLSGRVRFLDGHPVIENGPSYRMPLSFHMIKSQDWRKRKPLNLLMDTHHDPALQPKQWRSGYLGKDGKVSVIQLESRMKTAIDRTLRRSRESQLFGYQSIPSGIRFMMSVQCDNSEDLMTVCSAFGGRIRLGRSRSAEYGQAEMIPVKSPETVRTLSCGNIISLYLVSDLALEKSGMPVLKPCAENFGLPDSSILVSEKTFLKTRRYSPWNSFFNCRMPERQVLSRGSVICFEVPADTVNPENLQKKLSGGIGMHREEGLGQILVNPSWLIDPPVLEDIKDELQPCTERPVSDFLDHLERRSRKKQIALKAVENGRKWADSWYKLSLEIAGACGKDRIPGKSQWSKIREMATKHIYSTDSLTSEINEFCSHALRRRLWVDAVSPNGENLRGAIFNKTGNNPDDAACLTLYYASLEMGRILGRGGEQQQGSIGGHHGRH